MLKTSELNKQKFDLYVDKKSKELLFKAEEMKEKIKISEFYIVPGAAHMTPIENPDFVNNKIKTFLKNNFK